MFDNSISNILSHTEGRKAWPKEWHEQLEAPFAEDELQTGQDGLTYPKVEAVIRRLNEVFSGCWSAPIKGYEIVGKSVPFVIVTRALVINHPEYAPRVIENFGGKRLDKSSGYSNTDKDFKSAATMALRKCAMDLGVGLYLSAGKQLDDDLLAGDNADMSAEYAKEEPLKEAAKSPAQAPSSLGEKDEPNSSSGNQHQFLRDLLSRKGRPAVDDARLEKLSFNAASAKIEELKKLPDAPKSKKPAAASAPAPQVADSKQAEQPTAEPAEEPAGLTQTDVTPEPAAAGTEELLAKVRIELAKALKADDVDSQKVTDLMVHMYNKRAKKKIANLSEATAEALQELYTYVVSSDED